MEDSAPTPRSDFSISSLSDSDRRNEKWDWRKTPTHPTMRLQAASTTKRESPLTPVLIVRLRFEKNKSVKMESEKRQPHGVREFRNWSTYEALKKGAFSSNGERPERASGAPFPSAAFHPCGLQGCIVPHLKVVYFF